MEIRLKNAGSDVRLPRTAPQLHVRRSGTRAATPSRWSALRIAVPLFLLSLAPALAHAAFTVTRTSAPVFYYDAGDQVFNNYASYQVSTTTAVGDVWVRIENFSGGVVGLAPLFDGTVHLGPMSAGQTKMAYFYIHASGVTAAAQNHQVGVYDRDPTLAGAVLLNGPAPSFTLTSVQSAISASANKVQTVVAGPSPGEVGGIVTITVTGTTGTVGSPGVLSFNPATYDNWDANAYEIESCSITLPDASVLTDQLYVPNYTGANGTYTAVYRARCTGAPTAPQAVSPVSFIASGAQIKHTDPSSFAGQTILPAINYTRLTKSGTPDALPSAGGVISYTLHMSNNGPDSVRLDRIQDVLPLTPSTPVYVVGSSKLDGVAIADPVTSGNTIFWNQFFTVAPHSTRLLTYQTTISTTGGNYINSATGLMGAVQIDTTLSTTDNSPGRDTVFVQWPNLQVTKRHTSAFFTGANNTYTIVVRNVGTNPTVGTITVRDTLPTGLSFVGLTGPWSFSVSGQVVTATNGSALAVGDSLVLTLTVLPGAAAIPSVTNRAYVTTIRDLDGTNDSASDPTTVTGVPNIALTKRHTAAFVVGQTGTYTLVARNLGTAATAATITVKDTLGTGFTYNAASGAGWVLSQSGGIVTGTYAAVIAAGDSAKFTLTVNVAPAAFPSVTNFATATMTGDIDASNDRASDVTAITGTPDVVMSKRHTGPFAVGQNDTYTLVVRNTGTAATANTVTVRDTLPAGLAYVSGSGTGWSVNAAGQIVTATFPGVIAAGDSAKFTITVGVGVAAFPSVVNPATLSMTGDLDSSNDRATDPTTITGTPDVVIAKRHTVAFVHGQNGTYTIVVRNTGTGATANTVTVTDVLPAGLSFVSGAGTGWTVGAAGQTVTATFPGAIAAGDSAKFTLTVAVGAAAVPTVTNTASVSLTGDLNPGNNSGSDPTGVTGTPDVTLSKRHTVAFVHGQNGTYTIVVRNTGTAATANTVTVTDVLPAGLSFVSGAGTGWAVGAAGQTVTATFPGAIAAGDSAKFTLTVAVGAAAVPNLTNTATVSLTGDLDGSNNSGSDPTGVTGTPDVVIAKRHTVAFVHGQNGTYTIVVRNTGTAATANTVTVTDVLPAGLSFVSGAGTGWAVGAAGQTVTATFPGAIAAGDSAKFTVTVAVGAAAVPNVTNTATVALAGDLDGANNSGSDPTGVTGTPDVVIAKRHTVAFVHGQNGTYTIVVRNTGTAATANTVTVTDVLPAGLSFVSGAGTGWAVGAAGQTVTATFPGAIAAGDSAKFTLTVAVGAAAVPTVTNTASVSLTGDLNPGNNSGSDPTGVTGTPDVTLSKRHTVTFVHGQNGTYTIVVRNTGTAATANTVTVTDVLPAGLSFVTGSGTGWAVGAAGQTVTATFPGAIAAGDSAKFTVTVTVGAAAFPNVTNTATVALTGDLDGSNNSGSDPTTVTGTPDLVMDKRHTGAFVVGQPATYTIVVRNTGTAVTANTVTVTDVLPAGLAYVTGSGTGWTVGAAGQTVTATHGAGIAAGDSAKFTIQVLVGPTAFPGVTNGATLAMPGDLDPGNDGDTDPTTIGGAPQLALVKRHTGAFVDGQPGDYRIVVTNLGSGPTLSPIAVVDTLPAGLAYVSAAGPGWSASESGGVVTAQYAPALAVGDSAVLTLTVLPGTSAMPGVTNTARITSGDYDPSDDVDPDPTVVNGSTDATITLRHSANVSVNAPATLTVAVRNAGTGPLGTVTVTDSLPPGFAFVSATGTGWTILEANGVVSAEYTGGLAPGDSATFTIDVMVSLPAAPAARNAASVATAGDTNPANDAAEDVIPVQSDANLVLTKQHTVAFTDGQPGSWTLVVTNTGNGPTPGVVSIVDTLSAGITFAAASGAGWTVSHANGVVQADHGALAIGDSAVLVIDVTAGPAAVPGVTNVAWASGDGETGGDNRAEDATAVAGVVDLAIEKRHVTPLVQAQPGTYTFVVHNRGSAATSGPVTVRDTLPAGLDSPAGSGSGWSFVDGAIEVATYAGSIAPGDSVSFDLVVVPTAAAVPQVVNAASVEAAGDVDAANDRAVDPTEVLGLVDAMLAIRHTAPFVAGQDGTYTLVVRNLGSSPSDAIALTDTLPAGLVFASAPNPAWSVAPVVDSIVTATLAAGLAPGDSALFTLTVHVTAAAWPSVVNRGVVETFGDIDPANDAASDPTAITGAPDLVLAKEHAGGFTVGQPGTYTLRVRNDGNIATFGTTTVVDTLPHGLAFVAGIGTGWTVGAVDSIVTADLPAGLAPGDSASFTITVLPLEAAVPQVTNVAHVVTPGDPGGGPSDSASDPTSVARATDVAVAKRHTGDFTVGQPGTYRITVTNVGPNATTDSVVVTDVLPAGLVPQAVVAPGWVTRVIDQTVVAAWAAPVVPGDSVTFDVVVDVGHAAVPAVTNAVSVATAGDVNALNDATGDLTTVNGWPELSIEKNHMQPFVVGTLRSYQISVRNTGSLTSTGSTVTDTLPPGITFVSASGGGFTVTRGSAGDPVVIATHGTLPADGIPAVLGITVMVGAAAYPEVVNTAIVQGQDLLVANNRDLDTARVDGAPELALEKTHAATFLGGTTGHYRLAVFNHGLTAADAGTVTLVDSLPAGLAYQSHTGAGWSAAVVSGGVVTWTNTAAIAAGDSAALDVAVTVVPTAPANVTNVAAVAVPGDYDAANDRVADPTVVTAPPDLALDLRRLDALTQGSPAQYAIVVTNGGPGATLGTATVTDTLPAGLALVSATGPGWGAPIVSGNVFTVAYPGTIAAGDSAMLVVTVNVLAGAPALVTHAADVTTMADYDASNDRDSDTGPTIALPDVAIELRHTAPFTVGLPGTYTIVVRNGGFGPTTGAITVTDSLPASLVFAGATGTGWNAATASGGIVTIAYPAPLAVGDSAVLTLTVTPSAPGAVVNVAHAVTAGDYDAANDRATDPTLVAGVPDLALAKRHTGGFTVGVPGTYTLVVRNVGSAASAGAIALADTLPAGLSYTSLSGAGWSGVSVSGAVVNATYSGAIAPGDSAVATLTVAVAPAAAGGVTNVAAIAGGGDTNAANDHASDATAVAGVPDVALDKRHTTPFILGSTGTYTFVLRNLGSGPTAGAITLADTLPAGLTFASFTGTGWSAASVSGQIVTATFGGAIAAGDSALATLTVNVLVSAPSAVTNAATITGGGDTSPANDRDTDATGIGGAPDLAIEKRHVGAFRLGATGTYRIVVRNVGNAPTTGAIVVTDSLPPGLTYQFAAGADWFPTVTGNVVTAVRTLALAPGDSAALTIAVGVDAAALPSATNAASVAGGGDVSPGNGRGTDTVVITGRGLLVATKAAAAAEVEVGGAIDFTVTAANRGDAPVTNAEIVDVLPQGMRYVAHSTRVGTTVMGEPAGAPGPTLRFALGTLAPGRTVAVTYRVLAGAGSETGSGTNVATITGFDPTLGAAIASNSAAVTVRVTPGVFGDEGVIAGKVFVDRECTPDAVQGAEDLGIPGVRLYLEDGSTAITDAEGKYSFPHVRPRLHVVRVDDTTLPPGAALVPVGSRAAGSGVSRFVDVVRGELHRVDFAEGSRDPAVLAAIKSRRRAGEVSGPMSEAGTWVRPGAGYGDGVPAPGGTGGVRLDVLHADAPFVAPAGATGTIDAPGADPRAATGAAGDSAHAAAAAGAPAAAPRLTRGLLALGVLNARFDWRSLKRGELLGGTRDRFADELLDLAHRSDDGTFEAAGRAALFATGTVAGGTRVTLRYDSERDPDRRLFRDIRPDEGYAMLGDASVHGFEAPSAGRLFARAERGGSALQYGDFATPSRPGRVLGAFSRRLNGGIVTLDGGPGRVTGFASQGHQHQVVDELPAIGTSGPYALTHADGTYGSELVEVVTRDRSLPSRIVRREPMVRFVDYTIDPFTGRLVFTRPVASLDEHLNPVSIRVTYESALGGEAFWVYGGEARYAPSQAVDAGVAASRDDDPLAPRSLVSGDVTLHAGDAVTVSAELAQADSGGAFLDGDRSGTAWRGEAALRHGSLALRLRAQHAEIAFDNPSSGVAGGREEAGFDLKGGLGTHGTALFAEGIRTHDLRTEGTRRGVRIGLAQALPRGFAVEGWWRWSDETFEPADSTSSLRDLPLSDNLLGGRLTLPVPFVRRASWFAEGEQDMTWFNRHRFLVGGDVRVAAATRAYLRHENNASLDGPFAINDRQQVERTVFGLTSDEPGRAHVFSEYRLRDAAAGREAQAALGLRNRWVLRDGLAADAGFERVVVVRGGSGTGMALTGALAYTGSDLWKGSTRAEWRRQDGADQWLSGASVERKLTRDWAMLGRTQWFRAVADDRTDGRSQLGFAYRGTESNRLSALARYDNRVEVQGRTDGFRRIAHVVSSHANWQPVARWTLAGQLAAKWAALGQNGLYSRSTAQLLAGRAIVDVTSRLDAGVTGRGEFGGGRRYGMGGEVGYSAAKNLRLAAGYNLFGFSDPDMDDSRRTDKGPYFDFGWKFDPFWGDRSTPAAAPAGGVK